MRLDLPGSGGWIPGRLILAQSGKVEKSLLRTRAIYPTTGGLPSSPYGSTLGCV